MQTVNGHAGGELDGQDDVVESQRRGKLRHDHAPAGIDQHVVRPDPDLVEHGAQQRGLVFAVSVSVGENVPGWMGLVTADANLNGHVTDVPLNEGCQGSYLVKR